MLLFALRRLLLSIPLLVGITIFRERPTLYQVFGVALVLLGLFLLAIKPA